MEHTTKNFFPYGRQRITQEDIESVVEVLKSDFLTQGPIVPKFESELCKRLNVKHTIAVTNATSALHLACLSLGLQKGDILWTSPNTFVASANCAIYCGANIDFVDIDPNTGLMDVKKLSEKLRKAYLTKNLPKIIVPVHFSGSSCDMEKIYDLSKKYNFSIIEDASHAIGSTYKNMPVGNTRFSDFTVFSFHPVKIITTAEGGALCTNKKNLAETALKLRTHGIVKDEELFENESYGPWSYEQQILGFNYRMNDLQASLGLSQLKRLDEIVNERNRQLNIYKKGLEGLNLKFLEIPKNVRSSVHLGVVILKNFSDTDHKIIFSELRKNGVGVQLHYSPVHLNPYYRKMGFKEKDFINSENYARRAISLPIYPGLTDENLNEIITIIRYVLKNHDQV